HPDDRDIVNAAVTRRIDGEQLRTERPQQLRHAAANPTEADDDDGLVLYLLANLLVPATLMELAIHGGHAAQHRDERTHGQFGDGGGGRIRRREHPNAEIARGIEIDVRETGAAP